ncbi:hypothetical protein BN1012_Phect2728 [Candidatus Phaeomarinobacter ectocarpi]|uniref:Uncharacterized protein n=1 Tax=Candidatus Phaeomarinibacter ectocarpi TaxID=1458461 RepID=X5MP53_9HYPH|nr:hypothetical protein BN1012_Phect2728 [Candidatus Phaeomarinobacter ectocarpi]
METPEKNSVPRDVARLNLQTRCGASFCAKCQLAHAPLNERILQQDRLKPR